MMIHLKDIVEIFIKINSVQVFMASECRTNVIEAFFLPQILSTLDFLKLP